MKTNSMHNRTLNICQTQTQQIHRLPLLCCSNNKEEHEKIAIQKIVVTPVQHKYHHHFKKENFQHRLAYGISSQHQFKPNNNN